MSNIVLDIQQKNIIDAIQIGKNISINAVFGSGKTTTILETMERCSDKRAILITYNTHLKNEVHEKIIERYASKNRPLEEKNIEVYTYHSLCMKYFGYGKNDEELQMYHDCPPKTVLPHIDIIFIDEIQDMTLLLYTFVQKFIYFLTNVNDRESHHRRQIVICGDHLQGVYQFKGADKRFLTLGSEIYGLTLEPFEMTTSYRLTHPMSWFINECIYDKKILHTKKEGQPIIFFNQSPYKSVYGIIDKLQICLSKGIRAGDIFILAPSLKGGPNAPLKVLENMIYERLGLPVYYSTMEDRELNDKVIQNKVVFSTFHQSKGRERKVVIVFGFDDSYFDFYAKDEDRKECPSTLIVALSRAKEVLMIVKNIERKPVPFMKKKLIEIKDHPYIQWIGSVCEYETSKSDHISLDSFRKISVTDLVKYIKPEIQMILIEYKEKLFVKKTEVIHEIDLDPFVKTRTFDIDLYEDVSDLIGMIVPSVFEERQTGTCTIKEKLLEYHHNNKISDFMRERLNKIKYDSMNIEDLLYMVKVYKSLQLGIYSPFQIDHDDWMSKETLEKILGNMDYHIKNRQLYEYEFHGDKRFKFYEHPIYGKICITGRLDCLDRDVVWEFKCVKELSLEHFLQIVCYQWLWNFCHREEFSERTFRLLNIRTGEMYEMKKDDKIVQEMIDLLIANRYEKLFLISDEQFIDDCLNVKNTKWS
jgi:hypothetical protein